MPPTEPPAVVGLLAGRADADLVTAMCVLPGIPLLAFAGYLVVGGSRGIEFGILTGGMVLRRWEVENSDEGTSYYVAVDDGVSSPAWAFEVRAPGYRRLTPGTLAHVRINARLNKLIGIEATRPPATSPRLADPANPADSP
jgi:hypothetical protein